MRLHRKEQLKGGGGVMLEERKMEWMIPTSKLQKLDSLKSSILLLDKLNESVN